MWTTHLHRDHPSFLSHLGKAAITTPLTNYPITLPGSIWMSVCLNTSLSKRGRKTHHRQRRSFLLWKCVIVVVHSLPASSTRAPADPRWILKAPVCKIKWHLVAGKRNTTQNYPLFSICFSVFYRLVGQFLHKNHFHCLYLAILFHPAKIRLYPKILPDPFLIWPAEFLSAPPPPPTLPHRPAPDFCASACCSETLLSHQKGWGG